MSHRCRRLILCLAVLWQSVASATGQSGSGGIVGQVVDEAGAPVPGATVVVTSVATGSARTTLTDRDGTFAVPGVGPGTYRVRIALAGFRPLVRDGIGVATGDAVRVDGVLIVGGVDETVRVTADVPLLRAATAALGQAIDGRTVAGLPLNGRSVISLTALAPGVALPPGSTLPRINGGRPRTNEYLFDGISVLQPEPGQVAFLPNIDAIQDVAIISNSPPAEFGRFNGGVVSLTTKAGTNTWHGSVFEFARHEALNARHYFAPPGPKPVFRRHQAGGVAGGPLVRNRLFLFADYQGQRQSIARTAISTVPTLLQRQGVFTEPIAGAVPIIHDPASGTTTRTPFPGNAIPADRVDPVARRLLERYPLPTSGGTANNYRRVGSEAVDQDLVSARLDAGLPGERDRLFVRLTRFGETFLPVAPLPDGSGVASGTRGPQSTASQSLAAGYQHVFTDRLVHDLRLGDTRRHVTRTAAQLPSPASDALGLPGIVSTARFPNTLPTVIIAGYQQLGSPAGTATDSATSVTQVVDVLTWLRGRHTVKLGADLRWQRLDVVQPASPTGAFTFSSLFTDLPGTVGTGTPLASFLLGQVQQFSIDVQQDPIENRAHLQEYFAQDDWRVTDRVTINAGVRYTLNFPSVEVHDQGAVLNLTTRQLDYLGRDHQPRAARTLHTHNVGPRLGIVGRPTERTVVGAGYGLVWIEMTGITTPFTTPAFPFVQTVSQPALDTLTPAFTLAGGPTVVPAPLTSSAGLGQGVFAVDRDLGSGYVQQWNASLRRALTSHLALDIAYVGSSITRVGLPDANLNQLSVAELARGRELLTLVPNPYAGLMPPGSSLGGSTIPLAQLLKPYPEFTTVSLYRNNVGTTRYHGLTARLEQRLRGGLSFLVSHTRSRLVDDASSVFDASIPTAPVAGADHPADSYDRARERDYSTGDIPHVLVASAVWDLPFGAGRRRHPRGLAGAVVNDWTLSGVGTLQSGLPIAVTQATNTNAFAGFGIQRPNLVGDPTLPAGERGAARWFNTSAFATAPQFTLGTASRNPVRGPGYRNLDVALLRRVRLRSSLALELRVEAFNLTNTPALGAPNGVFGSAAFGSITTAGDPRVLQVAAKLVF
ncbi:MAG: TonB-dependent receptor [Acidobacteria bacterium]|nr:TonB-dependent receptor [Acidobacteriota bacterium]